MDLYSGFGSVSGSNNFKVDHSPLNQGSFSPGTLDLGDLLDPLEALFQFVEELTGLDISSPEKFLASLLALLGGIGATIASIIKFILDSTGIDFGNGPIPFLISLVQTIVNNITNFIEAILDNIGAIITAICNEFPIVWDQGPQAFIDSIVAALNKLGANIQAIIDNFLTMAFQLFGIDFQSVQAFFGSIIDAIVGNIQFVIDGFIANANAIFAALNEAFPIVWDQGPQAFIDSIVAILTTVGANVQDMIDNFLSMTFQLFGLDFSSTQAFFASFFEQIKEFIEQAITNVTVSVENILQTISQVFGFPGSINTDFIPNLEELGTWISQTVFGFIDPNRIPIIPISHISDTSVNLLSNPYFANTAIYDPSGLWSVDPTVTHHPIGGSAKTLCTDASHDLLSVDLIGVTPGQKLSISGWVKMDKVVGDGPNGIQLGVTTFNTADGSGNATNTNVATISTYGTRDWQRIGGEYTVPASGVVSLRVRIAASETAVSGTVWFDELFCGKQGLLPMNLVEGLISELGKIGKQITDGLALAAQNLAAGLTQAGEDIAAVVEWVVTELGKLLGLDQWQEFLNKIWIALTGKPLSPGALAPITPDDAADQLSFLMATTAAQATTIAQLQAKVNAVSKGVVGGDDFERSNNLTLQGDGWNVFDGQVLDPDRGDGYFRVNNGQCVWVDEGLLPNNLRCVRAAGKPDWKTTTPWQAITRVTGTIILENIIVTQGTDYLYGRVSDDGKAFVCAWWDTGTIWLGYNTGTGNIQIMRQAAAPGPPAAGVTYTLQCGSLDAGGALDSDDQFRFRVLRNNTVVIEHTDTARLTAAMKNNLRWGFGGAASGSLFGQVTPSSLHSVTVMDTKAS